MLRKNVLGTAIVGAVLIGACATAYADPISTATVNGVTFPIGIVPGGNTLQSGILDETLVTGPGDTFSGVGRVDSINNASSDQVWGNGQNGVELAFVFSGYTATAATSFPNLYFTGGTITFYTLAAGTTINGLGSVAKDEAAVEAGTEWLSEAGAPNDPAGDTLTSSILTGSSLSSFTLASGAGALDVTGGPAAAYFSTCTFANVIDTAHGGCSDATFTSDFSSGAAGDFAVSGSGTIKTNAVPEPLSLSLLGVGLVAVGIARRRRVSKPG